MAKPKGSKPASRNTKGATPHTERPKRAKAAPPVPQSFDLRPAEAIYAFAAWLTTREGTLKIGARHDAAEVARLVEEYRTAHGYAVPREDFHKRIPAPLPKL